MRRFLANSVLRPQLPMPIMCRRQDEMASTLVLIFPFKLLRNCPLIWPTVLLPEHRIASLCNVYCQCQMHSFLTFSISGDAVVVSFLNRDDVSRIYTNHTSLYCNKPPNITVSSKQFHSTLYLKPSLIGL
jgi:hypothetical protein